MKINLTVYELWLWRVSIIGLIIFCSILAQSNKQAQQMGLKNVDMILKQEKEITQILQMINTNQLAIISLQKK